jgi:hypothetical protein
MGVLATDVAAVNAARTGPAATTPTGLGLADTSRSKRHLTLRNPWAERYCFVLRFCSVDER